MGVRTDNIAPKSEGGTTVVCLPRSYRYTPTLGVSNNRNIPPVNLHLPRQSPTTRAMARSSAITELPRYHSYTISLHGSTMVRGQKPTVFPPRGFGDEVFGIQSTNDKDKSNADSDQICRHERPANGLIVVRRGADDGTRHVALPTSAM